MRDRRFARRRLQMIDVAAIENLATVSRTTAGISKYHGVDPVRQELVSRYTRDVHSPAIARRDGIHMYRHFSFGPLRLDLLPPTPGVTFDGPEAKRLTGAGHLEYLDDAALAAFYASPRPEVRDLLLADINIIGGAPGRTTTYRTSAGNGHTYVDSTGTPEEQGAGRLHRYALFLRQRGGEEAFRREIRLLAERWSRVVGVRRLRLHLFDVPDMTVERAHGYPIHPAPVDEHYQAWIDLALDDDTYAKELSVAGGETPAASFLAAIHCQPVPVTYTYVWGGRPTVVGLRGYPAWELINALGADNQRQDALLDWMYGSGLAAGAQA